MNRLTFREVLLVLTCVGVLLFSAGLSYRADLIENFRPALKRACFVDSYNHGGVCVWQEVSR